LIIKTVACIIGIAMGGYMVVHGAKGIAYNISYALGIDNGLMESLIGLTIVGVGTSLPELVTVLISSKKGENEISLGNVIGSNIFNIIFVVGLSATIAPFKIADYVIIDMLILGVVTLFVLPFIIKGDLNRKHSVLFIFMYIIYMVFLVLRML
jgi:cation:H+ antiporter